MSKRNLILAATLALMFTSCKVVKDVPYFQDVTESGTVISPSTEYIKVQPEDKLCIVVTCKDPELTQLFNLPYISQRIGAPTDAYNTSSQNIACYTIDDKGNIDFPVVGRLHIEGMTRSQVEETIKAALENNHLVKDPVVTVDFSNLTFSVMGEVSKPGRYSINRDCLTILDALSMAGDMTIYGKRDAIKIIRKCAEGDVVYIVNLNSAESLASSPVYYLKQGDLIYVEPNKMRSRQTTVNGNTVLSASFWISVASLVASVLTTVLVALLPRS